MAEMKVVKILKLSQFDKVFDQEELTDKIKEFLGQRNIGATPCARMIKQRVTLTFASYFIKKETRIYHKFKDLEECGKCDDIDSTFLRLLHRDYYRIYWKMHIRSLREERENFNEEEFFAIERIDRQYDRMKKEDDNDDDRVCIINKLFFLNNT